MTAALASPTTPDFNGNGDLFVAFHDRCRDRSAATGLQMEVLLMQQLYHLTTEILISNMPVELLRAVTQLVVEELDTEVQAIENSEVPQ